MKIIASIVSVGNWNSKIFTPEWVSSNVFSMSKGDTMNIGLDQQKMSFTYTWNDINFSPTDRGVELRLGECNAEKLATLDAIYKHLVEILPYTPINAFGYNFNLILTNEEYSNTPVAKIITEMQVANYDAKAYTFRDVVDGVKRSFDVRVNDNGTEINCNFEYKKIADLPKDGTAFDIIKTELKKFIGDEYSL